MQYVYSHTKMNRHADVYVNTVRAVETFCINLEVSIRFCFLFNVDYIVLLLSYAGKAPGSFDSKRIQRMEHSECPTAAWLILLELYL